MERVELAERLFLIVHDPFTGKLAVSPELLKSGLVAAELADLVMEGRLGTTGGHVVVAERRGSGDDGIGAFVVEAVARQRGSHTVRAWAETLGDALYELVARRLVDRGVVRRERGSRLIRRGADRFPAVDLLAASSPRGRLEHMLGNPADFDLAGAVSAAIIGALGVEHTLDIEVDRSLLDELAGHLPVDIRTLMAGLEQAAAAISLTVRR